MSQMPDKIWLHKDTKYNTGDIVSAYQYEFAQGIEDEGIENFVEYVPADAFIEKAVSYLEGTLFNEVCYGDIRPDIVHAYINDFKKAMRI